MRTGTSEELSKVLQPPTSPVCWFICLLPTFAIILWCYKPQINQSISYSYTFQTSSLRAKEWCTLPILKLKKNDLTSWSAVVSVALWELKIWCQPDFALPGPYQCQLPRLMPKKLDTAIFPAFFLFSLIFQNHFKSSFQGKRKFQSISHGWKMVYLFHYKGAYGCIMQEDPDFPCTILSAVVKPIFPSQALIKGQERKHFPWEFCKSNAVAISTL